ncbi:MAG: hypothetical protein U0931_02315 [Vulcanimicrobiota bacterium]
MALLTVLALTVLLLLLGLTFLDFIEADYRFAAQEDRRQQAYDLALSGLEYQRRHSADLYVGAPAMPLRKFVPASSSTHFFEVTVMPDGSVVSRGVVCNSFRELASHRLVVDPGKSMPEARTLP